VDWLTSPAFFLWSAPVTWAEVFGDVAGALCVWLLARQHILNWPLGLANNVLWCVLFWHSKLYADSVLQVCFFVLGVYGWYTWLFGGAGARNSLPVRRTTRREWTWLSLSVCIATVGLGTFLDGQTDSPVPFWDASILTLSLAATYGQAQKAIECWWVWIAVDVISVPLYISRSLYPTAALYVVFGVLCVIGLREWRQALRADHKLAIDSAANVP
jgi:nicotinamide mononucleotide transporter